MWTHPGKVRRFSVNGAGLHGHYRPSDVLAARRLSRQMMDRFLSRPPKRVNRNPKRQACAASGRPCRFSAQIFAARPSPGRTEARVHPPGQSPTDRYHRFGAASGPSAISGYFAPRWDFRSRWKRGGPDPNHEERCKHQSSSMGTTQQKAGIPHTIGRKTFFAPVRPRSAHAGSAARITLSCSWRTPGTPTIGALAMICGQIDRGHISGGTVDTFRQPG